MSGICYISHCESICISKIQMVQIYVQDVPIRIDPSTVSSCDHHEFSDRNFYGNTVITCIFDSWIFHLRIL